MLVNIVGSGHCRRVGGFGQNVSTIEVTFAANGNPYFKISNLLFVGLLKKLIEIDSNRYKLYPTENIYNFLKLDTQTGRIDQIQWSLDSKKEFSRSLNREDLSTSWSETANSFKLYPTQICINLSFSIKLQVVHGMFNGGYQITNVGLKEFTKKVYFTIYSIENVFTRYKLIHLQNH